MAGILGDMTDFLGGKCGEEVEEREDGGWSGDILTEGDGMIPCDDGTGRLPCDGDSLDCDGDC